MVEGKSLKTRQYKHNKEEKDNNNNTPQMTGRTNSGKIVHFCGQNINPGDIVNVKIKNAYPHSLWGEILQTQAETV